MMVKGIWKSSTFILLMNWFAHPAMMFAIEPSPFPKITEIKPGIFQFGDILIHKKERNFSLPAQCNQTSGLVEYALVHEMGKVHESLFRTRASPRLIHACMLLLKESPQRDFFLNMQTNPESLPPLRTIEIFVEWEQNGTLYTREFSPMVLNQMEERSLEGNSFVFTGSQVIEGVYLAEEDGSIIAIYHDNRATINCKDLLSHSDDVWTANRKNMPPKDLPVTIRFQLPSLN